MKRAVIELMQDAPLIHLSTHGFVGDEYPKGVRFLTPDSDSGDAECCNAQRDCCVHERPCTINCATGLLSAEELAQLKLNVRLMVLSACQTG